jgi:hypothetical protein
MSKKWAVVLAAIVVILTMISPALGCEDMSYDPEWYTDACPQDSELVVRLSAPSVGMTAETAKSDLYCVMITFYNADYDAVYEVEHDLDTELGKDADEEVRDKFSDIKERNDVSEVPGADLAGGYMFYMRDGQSVAFRDLPRSLEYGIKVFAPEAFDTMYRTKRESIVDKAQILYSSMSGPELESTLGNDKIYHTVELALVSPMIYN